MKSYVTSMGYILNTVIETNKYVRTKHPILIY